MLKNLRWGKTGGEQTDWLFFSPGEKRLVSFFIGEEMGRPDLSPGKDWRREKTNRYTGLYFNNVASLRNASYVCKITALTLRGTIWGNSLERREINRNTLKYFTSYMTYLASNGKSTSKNLSSCVL